MKSHTTINRAVSVAPMMDCTNRHYRQFMRLITRHTLLYSEMVTTGAVIHGDRDHLLAFGAEEHPVALQLGGSDPKALALSAKIAEDFAYDEVNLNVGCPSSRVQAGRFGACLMKDPVLVADCFAAMQDAVSIPVTVKTRTGVDEFDSFAHLQQFVETVAKAGCQTFIIHARKAWLKGLSPRDNRKIPPLNYDCVYQLKKCFPELEIIINGGIKTIEQMQAHLVHVDGVMIGREAYAHPYFLAPVDGLFFQDDHSIAPRDEIVMQYLPYVASLLAAGVNLRMLMRHLVGLFQGVPGAKNWRRYLSENMGGELDVDEIKKRSPRCSAKLTSGWC